MLRAGALYFALISAFLIAVICASLIMVAAYYRDGYLKVLRAERLQRNMESSIAYVLGRDNSFIEEKNSLFDLLGEGTDSVNCSSSRWGIFELSMIKAFISNDTIKTSFLVGIDTRMDTLALYLSDEDRPLSVSGDTRLSGDVAAPKSGMRKSYVENRPYSGDKLVYGKILESGRILPALSKELISSLEKELDRKFSKLASLPGQQINAPFLGEKKAFALSPSTTITGKLSGKIALYADSTVFISREASLDNVVIYAQSIVLEEGFKGNCQLFARDSIIVGDKVVLDYPSVLGLLAKEKMVDQARIIVGKQAEISGVIFSYEPNRSPLQTMISFSENTKVKGEVYATGLVKLAKGVELIGKTSCNRFVMQTPTTLYENFLVDVKLNRRARDRHYLTSSLFEVKQGNKGVLKWLK